MEKIMEKLHKFTHNIFTDVNIESDELANAIVLFCQGVKLDHI